MENKFERGKKKLLNPTVVWWMRPA